MITDLINIFKILIVCESQEANNPMLQKKKVETRTHFKKRGDTEKPHE